MNAIKESDRADLIGTRKPMANYPPALVATNGARIGRGRQKSHAATKGNLSAILSSPSIRDDVLLAELGQHD